ncbi:MAG: hypothetical protein L3J51_11965 [Cocleimonas sp.]|nr:hypothetical protein [Cocleimonas sp.]
MYSNKARHTSVGWYPFHRWYVASSIDSGLYQNDGGFLGQFTVKGFLLFRTP